MNRLKRPALCVALLALVACHNPITDPKPLLLDTEVESGPPEYRLGFSDGCKSALSAYGNTYMRSIYKVNKSAQYADNKMYNQTWKDAWNYCYMWIFAMRQDKSSGAIF